MKQEHFCSNCGTKIIETGSKFCGNCGSVLDVSLKTPEAKQDLSQNKSSVQSGFRLDFRTILILGFPVIPIILFVVVIIGDFIVDNQAHTAIDNMAKEQYAYLDQNQDNCVTRSELNRYENTDFPFFERFEDQFQDESEFTSNGKYAFWEYGSFRHPQLEEKFYRDRERLRKDIQAYYEDNNETTEHPYKERKEQLELEYSGVILNVLYNQLSLSDNCISAEKWDDESLGLEFAYFEMEREKWNVFDVLPGIATLLVFASPFVMVVLVYIFPRSKQDKHTNNKNQKLFFIILLVAIVVGMGSCISSGF